MRAPVAPCVQKIDAARGDTASYRGVVRQGSPLNLSDAGRFVTGEPKS